MASKWAQIASTSGTRVGLVAAQLLSTAITARYLGPEGRGTLVAATTWVSTFAMIGYLSMAQPVFHRVSGKDPAEWLPETLGSLLGIVAVVTMLGWAVAAAAFTATGGALFTNLDGGIVALAFTALPFLLWQENNNSLLLAQGKLDVLNRMQLAAGGASLVLVPLFVVVFGWGVPGAVAAVLANPLMVSSIGVVYLLRRTPTVRFDWGVAKQLLVGGAKLHLSSVGAVLAGQMGLLIVNHYRSTEETAYLHLAGQMLMGLLIIPGAVSSVAYTLVAKHGPDGAWPEHRRLMAQTLALVACGAVVAYFAAPLGVRILAGEGFEPAVEVFRISLLTVLGGTLAGLTVSQWISRGFFSLFSGYGVVLGALTALGTYLVAPRFGMLGVAWLGVAASAVTVLVNGALVVWIERRWRRGLAHAA
ncbi:MAG TPA: oligosaccharide flippase family protein [Longimicrobium sp.]|jgi:O-antigen/teichoic acid export membrane protein